MRCLKPRSIDPRIHSPTYRRTRMYTHTHPYTNFDLRLQVKETPRTQIFLSVKLDSVLCLYLTPLCNKCQKGVCGW